MAGKVFVCYRRDDAAGYALALYDRLRSEFGEPNIFMDVDSIGAGVDFVTEIEEALTSCHVFLALIGKAWLSARKGSLRRLDDANDFVRLEIAAALKRDIRVIPVLLEHTSMPKAKSLPKDLVPLVRRNAIEVSSTHFGSDVDHLIRTIHSLLKTPDSSATQDAPAKAASLQPARLLPDLTLVGVHFSSSVELRSHFAEMSLYYESAQVKENNKEPWEPKTRRLLKRVLSVKERCLIAREVEDNIFAAFTSLIPALLNDPSSTIPCQQAQRFLKTWIYGVYVRRRLRFVSTLRTLTFSSTIDPEHGHFSLQFREGNENVTLRVFNSEHFPETDVAIRSALSSLAPLCTPRTSVPQSHIEGDVFLEEDSEALENADVDRYPPIIVYSW